MAGPLAQLLPVAGQACVAIPALIVVAVLLPWLRNRWQYRAIPGPFAPPFIGNLPAIVRYGLHEYMDMCRRKYGKIFKMYLGSGMTVVIADPDFARKINYRYINRQIGAQLNIDKKGDDEDKVAMNGLVAAKDEKWRTLRLAWQPAFQSGSLEGYGGLMDECAVKLGELLAPAAEAGEVINIWRELGKMTMQVVGTTAYGVDFHTMSSDTSMSEEGAQLVEASKTVFSSAGITSGSLYLPLLVMFPKLSGLVSAVAKQFPDKKLVNLVEARKTISNISLKLIDEWKKSMQGQTSPTSPASSPTPTAKKSTSLLLEEEQPPVLVSAAPPSDDGSSLSSPSASGTPRGGSGDLTQTPAADTAAAAAAAAESTAGTIAGTPAAEPTGADADAAADAAAVLKRAPGVGVDPGSFLGLMLNARSKVTGEQLGDKIVVAQSNTFILAGYETTANTLAFCIYNIAADPEVQRRVLEEVDGYGRDKAPRVQDMHMFPYIEGVVKESLRLYPPATLLNREVKGQPFEVLPGVFIPEGKPIFTAVYAYQRDEEFWPQPLRFAPERFMAEGDAQGLAPKNPNAWTPFGTGPRMCIGWKFALQEAKIALIRLYQRYTFELAPDQIPLPLQQNLTLSPRGGVYVKAIKRQG